MTVLHAQIKKLLLEFSMQQLRLVFVVRVTMILFPLILIIIFVLHALFHVRHVGTEASIIVVNVLMDIFWQHPVAKFVRPGVCFVQKQP